MTDESLEANMKKIEKEMQANSTRALTQMEIRTVQDSWQLLTLKFSMEKVGLVLFKNIFKLAPETLNLFPFKNERNMYESQAF